MKRIFVPILISLFFFSCQNVEKVKKPDNLISEDKMVDIITELSLLHSARNYNKTKFESTGIDPDSFIYKKYNIDSLQFEQSNNYYADNYVRYEDIYSRVKDRLQAMKVEYDSLRKIEMDRKDSIANARRMMRDSLNRKKDSLRKPEPPKPYKTQQPVKDSLIEPPVAKGIQ